MGSVIGVIECPNCKSEAWNDFYYKTGEEYTHCEHCGYYHAVTIINRDKKLSELTDEDWKVTEIKEPYGAYRIKHHDGIGFMCGSLENESQYQALKQEVSTNETIELFTVSRYIDGKVTVEILVNNGPKIDSAGFTHEDNCLTEADCWDGDETTKIQC